ncbi:minichromosome maintenance protein MCM [Halopiger xanaduensis]|uniref:DNA helicase n=1 Tax=Halopiger xanaduensis (strain DSM 18323 / JCM 14033 / SH-6) TaxID=797210 RepID=F8DEM3_HALXS|nr:minichromosome maintenance protein MCM [Halopiger xanaduensis]AEH39460.1 MCM family protein [Halopiger xanaduensis SH-6]
MSHSQTGSSELVDTFEQFFRDYYDDRESENGDTRILDLAQKYPNEQKSLYIDYGDLYQFDPDLADDVLEHGEDVLKYAEEALRNYDLPIDVQLNADVRLSDLDSLPPTRVFDVGKYPVDMNGKYVAVQGQVNKVGDSKGKVGEAAFECQLCGTLTRVPQSGDWQEPHECQGCERQGPFQVNWDQSELKDYQLVRLQLPPEKAHRGGQASDIDVRVLGSDMTDSVAPGDRVTVGIELEPEIDDEDRGTFVLTGEANNIEHQDTDYEDLDLDEYEDEILELAESDNIYQKIVDSFKPSHHGDEQIKLAIALQMFGGVEKHLPDGSRIRGNSHIFLVGAPSTDKSGLLEYARDLSPRSVYTSGQSATQAGLTCAAVQDDFGNGGWTIEGGALVKAHKGLCAIDEFDKMDDEDQSGVMEAMSQGTISPAKANISNVTLPANTTVLSAANPEYGRFDEYEPIGEQIDLPPELISRFDLIFTLTDKPDEEKDEQLVEHLNQTAYVGGKIAAGEDVSGDELETVDPEISKDMLRRYIAYAKQNVTPTLSEGARERIKQFYTEIRASTSEDDAVPVTARKILALHRLAEASARMRLSDTATVEDANRVIQIVLDCLEDVGVDPETGEFDADMVEANTSKSQRDRIKGLKGIISDLELEYDDGAPIDIVKERASDQGMTHSKVEHEIEKLKDKGEVYEPNDDHLRAT